MARKKPKAEQPPDEPDFVAQVPDAPQRVALPDGAALLAKRVLNELAGRQCEALRLYVPLPKVATLHSDDVRTKIALGSNQAGKTLGAAVEFARAVTGQDPFDKYPKTDGIAFVFGLDGKHLGSTIYRKVFRAGAFQMIRDEVTNLWRVFNPVTDKARKHLVKPAPPLIPPRFIKHIAWEEKKAQIPKIITLKNGWELHFFSSRGSKPQGQQIDLWWIDEEILDESLHDELIGRTMMRRGKGLWSATPQNASLQLFNLHELAEQQENAPVPDVREYKFRIVDNPFIEEEEKERIYRMWSDEQRDIRYHGEFAIRHLIIYPEFSAPLHGYDDNFVPPDDWSLYFATDPGYETCATLFLAVPPRHVGRFVVVYDELYLHHCDAAIYAKGVASKTRNTQYEAAFIDYRYGRQHETGTGMTYEEHYRRALKKAGVEFRNGTYYTWAADNPKAGIEAVRDWLRIVPSTGKPFLRVCTGRVPNFMSEIKRYRYKRVRNATGELVITDEPDKTGRRDHLMDDLRYLAAGGPTWRAPKMRRACVSPAVRAMQSKKRQLKAKGTIDDGAHVSLG